MTDLPKFKTLIDVINYFQDETFCYQYLAELRWGGEPISPFTGSNKVYKFKDGKTYKCAETRKKFNARTGTIFEDSKIPLKKWFVAIYLLTNHKKGISSLQLSKDLGITQKSAWFVLHRLRLASLTKEFRISKLKNKVEVDETYIGGKEKNKHNSKKTKGTQGRSLETKTAVLGMLERGGIVKTEVLRDAKSNTIQLHIMNNVLIGSNLMTDEYRAYNGLASFYNHSKVNHSTKEYVIGEAYTNTLEGYWSLAKRSVIGIYHFISKPHIHRYFAEFSFRYNTRELETSERFDYLLQNTVGRLTYKQLTGK
jgi:transposase-like protein